MTDALPLPEHAHDPEHDDLPMLTDVVDEAPEGPAPMLTTPILGASMPLALAERIAELDTCLRQQIEDWLNQEIPRLIWQELDHVAERVRTQALGSLHDTLLPRLSAEIIAQLQERDTP